jgi:hypothetical protein
MLPGQKGFSSKSVAPELDIQKMPQHTVADDHSSGRAGWITCAQQVLA